MRSETNNPKTKTVNAAISEEEQKIINTIYDKTQEVLPQLNEIFKTLVELKLPNIPNIPGKLSITIAGEYICTLTITMSSKDQWRDFRMFSLDELKKRLMDFATFYGLERLGFEVIEVESSKALTCKSFSIKISNCNDIERIYQFCMEKKNKTPELKVEEQIEEKESLELKQKESDEKEWIIIGNNEGRNGESNTSVKKAADSQSEEEIKKSKIKRLSSSLNVLKGSLFKQKRRAGERKPVEHKKQDKFQDGGEESPVTEIVRPSQPSRQDSLTASSLFPKSTVVIVTEGELATVSYDPDTANSDPSEQNRV